VFVFGSSLQILGVQPATSVPKQLQGSTVGFLFVVASLWSVALHQFWIVLAQQLQAVANA